MECVRSNKIESGQMYGQFLIDSLNDIFLFNLLDVSKVLSALLYSGFKVFLI